MPLGGAIEAALLVAILVPLRRRMVGPALPPGDGPFSAHPVVGLLAPLAGFLDRLIVMTADQAPEHRRGRFAATLAVFMAPLFAFTLVPLGVEYVFESRTVSLVAIQPEGGIVWLIVALLVGLHGAAALLPSPDERVLFAVSTASFSVAAGFSVAALAMVYGTLDPIAIAAAQDTTLGIGSFFGPALPALQALELPAWGVFRHPASFLLFAATAISIPSLVVSASGTPEGTREIKARDGVEAFLLDSARHAGALVLAAWLVVFFFGGGAVPFATRDEIVGFISPFYGEGLGKILCMAIHVGVFVSKLMLTTMLLEPLGRRIAGFALERALGLCWRYAIPFALLNIFVTAQWLGDGVVPR